MNWLLLKNSLFIAASVTFFAGLAGFMGAIALAGAPRSWRAWLMGLCIMVLALPSFMATNCWLDLLGNTGLLRPWLPLSIYSFGGVIFILTTMYWPLTTLLVMAAWRKISSASLESDPCLRGAGLLRWLLVPAARASLLQAGIITFVLALNNFAVPAILQVKIYAAEIWIAFSTTFNYWAAARASGPFVVIPLVLLFFLWRRPVAWPWTHAHAPWPAMRSRLGPRWRAASFIFLGAALMISAAIPWFQLLAYRNFWPQLWTAVASNTQSIAHSLGLALATAGVCAVLGLMLWRKRIGLLVWLLFFVPGIVLGISLTWMLNRPPFLLLYRSLGIVILAGSLRYLAPVWAAASSAGQRIDHELVDAARLAGASKWQLLRLAYWPQMAPYVLVSAYIVYLLCLWDVETLVLLTPPGGDALALRIFNLLHYGHNVQVNALCLSLVILAAAPLALWAFLGGLKTRRSHGSWHA